MTDNGDRLELALKLVSGLVLEDGRRWGEVAEPWQVEDVRAIMDPDPSAPRLHFLTRPRGGSKTTDLAAVAMAIVVAELPPGARGYAVAADADQARLLLDAMRGFAMRSGFTAEHLAVEARRVVAPRKQASLEVLPADAPSAWGLRPHLVICDELAQWPSTPNARGVWEAVVSAMPKVRGSRLVVLTSAGDPAHWSHKVLAQARRSPRWRVHEVAGPTPWIEPDALEEQRALLTESQYARLHLNQWTAAEDRLVRPEDLAACVVLDGPVEPRAGVSYRVGVDIGLRHDRTVVAVCHSEPVEDGDGEPQGPDERARRVRRVVLDRMVVLQGSRKAEVQLADVERAIVEACGAYKGARVRLDPWQAIGLRQRLEARRVRVEEYAFGAQSVGRLASTLHLLLRDHLLALPEDEALLDELANVRLRETAPGVLRMDHDPGRHDDRAIALALAATALVEDGIPVPVSMVSPVGHRVQSIDPKRSGSAAALVTPQPASKARRGLRLPSIAGRRGPDGERR